MGNTESIATHDLPVDLRERRALLASVLGIVRFMEGLQGGLEAIQLLGEEGREVPRFARQFLGGMDKHLKQADSKKLQGYLVSLERLVQQDLTRILKIAGADRRVGRRPDDPDPNEPPPGECQLVDDFRRRTQTVISLRVLLRKRGEPVGAVILPVPEKLLNETLAKLDRERCAHAERALGEAMMLIKDIDVRLQSRKLSEGMREQLSRMRSELQLNVEHLKAGKPVSELPVPIETPEAEDVEWLADRKGFLAGEAEGQEENDAEAGCENSEQSPEESAAEGAAAGQAEVRTAKKRGVLARAWKYVTTSTDVGWKDTER